MSKIFDHLTPAERSIAIQRLTALWALNECGVGGILHAVQSPFTGLVVGSIAMICIALICSIAENKWKAAMMALMTVLIIKAMVSPHSSPTAYFAVAFQGVTGAIIYRYVPGLLAGSLLFVSLGLIESALQRLLTLTILYGNTLWEAIDIWGEWISKNWGFILPVSSSRLLIYAYLVTHLMSGAVVGYFTYRILRSTHFEWGKAKYALELRNTDQKTFITTRQRGKGWRKYISFMVLIALIIFAFILQKNAGDIEKGLLSVLRAILILAVWFLFIAPIFIRLIKKFLARKHGQLSEQVSQTLAIMPKLVWILDKAWKETKPLPLFRRWNSFVLHSLLYILQYRTADDPHIDRTGERLQDLHSQKMV